MTDTLITIPGVAAHHILGDSTVTLGAGELNIVPATSGNKDLLLTVGSAGFTLHNGTPFGTLEGDTRSYVFTPEIEGVIGGYVKLTLPEGVAEDGSRLSELQTKLEEILIGHGLLQPAGADNGSHGTQRIKNALSLESDKPLVSIPGVVAAQVVGEETTILSQGTLDVLMMPPPERDNEPVLTLTVGKSAFPLYKNTAFGTLANDSRTYVFTLDIEGVNKGFVAIVLPDSPSAHDASAALSELQNQLELILIDHGLLKDGFSAFADELARSVREDSTRTAERIRAARDNYLATNPRTIDPAEFKPAAHNVAGSAASGTQTVANAAQKVSGAVMSGAAAAGAWIASTFVPTDRETTERLNTTAQDVADVATGVAAGVVEVKDSLKDAAGTVIENDYGDEAREVVGNVGQSVSNVGAAVGDVASATSGVPIAFAGLQGAATRQDCEQKVQEIKEEKAGV